MRLRDYQQDAFDKTMDEFTRNTSVLAVMATGLGKTVFFSHIANEFKDKGRIMLLAHREELIFQGAAKMTAITGEETDVEMGNSWATNYFKTPIVVSTIQTQVAGKKGEERMLRFDPYKFALVIVDEAHHATANTYRRVLNHFMQNPNLKVLGVTATPDRTDEEALGQIFDEVSFDYDIRNGINDGWLVPIEQVSVLVQGLDLSECKSRKDDLVLKDLAKVMEFEEVLHGIADPTIKLTGDRKTLVFAASVAQAERLTEILNRHKPKSAKFVCGKTPKDERREMLRDYKKGTFQYLVNVGVATEGFDEPDIQVVVMARPTKSRCLFTQMAGRGTRPAEIIAHDLNDIELAVDRRKLIAESEKTHVTIIDFVGNSGKHKLVNTADILGGIYSDEADFKGQDTVVERAKKNAEKKSVEGGMPVDMLTELEEAERQLKAELADYIEKEKRRDIKPAAKYLLQKGNPFDVLDIKPQAGRAWHKDKPLSEKQVALLDKAGINTKDMTYTQAQQVIGRVIEGWDNDTCSFKQARALKKARWGGPETSFGEAKRRMNWLMRKRDPSDPRSRAIWKVPHSPDEIAAYERTA